MPAADPPGPDDHDDPGGPAAPGGPDGGRGAEDAGVDGSSLDDGAGLGADFRQLVGDARSRDAVRARMRERGLRAAASADATLAGVLMDLAERDEDLAVRTASGRTAAGRVVLVAADAIAVRTVAGLVTYVPLTAVTSVRRRPGDRAHPGEDEPGGDRLAPAGTTFATLVADLALDRCRVAMAVAGEGALVIGELRAAGTDVVAVRVDADPPVVAYVALASLSEVTILASG